MKVLVSAYACEPNKGSEPGVGWNWAKQIARFHQVWVITRANNQPIIEEELKKTPVPAIQFHYLDLPEWMKFWKKGTRGLYLYYYLWQIAAYFSAKKLHKQIRFDAVHHVTFVNDWLPSFMCLLPISFIWGPIGSHQEMPASFRKELSIKIRFYESIKDFTKNINRICNLFVRATAKRAKLIITINKRIKQLLPKKYWEKAIIFSAIGINKKEMPEKQKEKQSHEIMVLSAGRLVYWKGFHWAINAFIKFNKKFNNSKLYIVGEGPNRKHLEKLVQNSYIHDRVIFAGNVPKNETLNYFAKTDIFLYPSFEEAGIVYLEAMAAGKPIICLDYGGAKEIVTDECAIKIRINNPEQIISKLAEALELLASNQKLRKQLGESAKKRVKEVYDWDKKGEIIKKIYQQYLEKNAAK
jgi:glycosyltransferase involved in cell wall biosynthesis